MPIQTPYYTQFARWIEDDSAVHSCNIDTACHGFEILEGMCLSALNNVRVDLPITDLGYTPVLERMKRELPPCGTVLRKLYDGKTPRKERDLSLIHISIRIILVSLQVMVLCHKVAGML